MIPHTFACLPHAPYDTTASAAGALPSETHGTANVDVEVVVERVNAYGFHADPVQTTGVWWVPFHAPSSMNPLATGVRVEWAL